MSCAQLQFVQDTQDQHLDHHMKRLILFPSVHSSLLNTVSLSIKPFDGSEECCHSTMWCCSCNTSNRGTCNSSALSCTKFLRLLSCTKTFGRVVLLPVGHPNSLNHAACTLKAEGTFHQDPDHSFVHYVASAFHSSHLHIYIA